MTTNDCGHPLSAEDSVLRCAVCEGEELTRRDDATWNAAIEAAAKACEDMEAARNGWTGWPKCCAEAVRSLKRGQS